MRGATSLAQDGHSYMFLNVHALIIAIQATLQLVTNLSNAKNIDSKLSRLTTSRSRILRFPSAKAKAQSAAAVALA